MADPDVKTRHNPKWIRGYLDGRLVVDSRDALFVWEHEYYPAWYFPGADVAGRLTPNSSTFDGGALGPGARFDLKTSSATVADAGWRHLDAPDPVVRDRVRLEWEALDSWFEEDVEVFVHPRSPDVRIDVLPTSKHVRVSIDGVVVADSVRASVLYEASLPPRYYLPQPDVRMELLTSTDTTSACPYKGFAHYWSVVVDGRAHDDIAWGYRAPFAESGGVAGLVCFYNEQVEIEIDGAAVSRPVTKFS